MMRVAIESLHFGRARRKRPTVPHSDETKLKLAANAPRAVVSETCDYRGGSLNSRPAQLRLTRIALVVVCHHDEKSGRREARR